LKLALPKRRDAGMPDWIHAKLKDGDG
jgi:hypothetical protein